MKWSVLNLAKKMPMGKNARHFSSLVTTSLELDGKMAIISLNNPTKLNALSDEMANDLLIKVDELKNMADLRVAILTGAGKAFSAGGDLQYLLDRSKDTPENNIKIMQEFYSKFLLLRSLPVPIIAAINGPAVGAGLCLAMGGADLRVASRKAKMGATFTKLGLHPGALYDLQNLKRYFLLFGRNGCYTLYAKNNWATG